MELTFLLILEQATLHLSMKFQMLPLKLSAVWAPNPIASHIQILMDSTTM